jgi:hypothetical protein
MRASSSQLDELYLRPSAQPSSYRKVLIEPVPVALRSDWLKQSHAYNRIQSLYPPYTDAERVTREMSELVQADLAEAFRAGGYEVVAAPGPGVLRVSASVSELFINAPDRLSPWLTRTLTRDAGQARLSLEARDAASGLLLARAVHLGIAREVSRVNSGDDVSNRMWFDALFRRWASSCVSALTRAS